ncbi:hypothetical protein D9615_003500 [Tricholomella constricta]|uniref:Uncharacterized protein n=1 Tax=Tricholomella constricta TaxID=117010 RepID=A0A8H5M7I9_9AGAR|nr:hypothetical protein D9615_003500 [Tricholomella constricta]
MRELRDFGITDHDRTGGGPHNTAALANHLGVLQGEMQADLATIRADLSAAQDYNQSLVEACRQEFQNIGGVNTTLQGALLAVQQQVNPMGGRMAEAEERAARAEKRCAEVERKNAALEKDLLDVRANLAKLGKDFGTSERGAPTSIAPPTLFGNPTSGFTGLATPGAAPSVPPNAMSMFGGTQAQPSLPSHAPSTTPTLPTSPAGALRPTDYQGATKRPAQAQPMGAPATKRMNDGRRASFPFTIELAPVKESPHASTPQALFRLYAKHGANVHRPAEFHAELRVGRPALSEGGQEMVLIVGFCSESAASQFVTAWRASHNSITTATKLIERGNQGGMGGAASGSGSSRGDEEMMSLVVGGTGFH